MTWIGIDDTDSPRGGCTTFALTEVIRAAAAGGFDLIGEPRLVRLNPNIPYKTRGNAALSARFGHGLGAPREVGRQGEEPIVSYLRASPLSAVERDQLVERAWEAVLAASRLGEPGTDPALVAVPRRLPAQLYWNAVQRRVPLRSVERLLRSHGATVRTAGARRGLVGAASAVAWPGAHPTFELITYRSPARQGERRVLDRASVRRAERRFSELFVCTDPATRRVLIAPHTPCPILYGLRATRPDRLVAAMRVLHSEPVERYVIFRTNQGSGDHLSCRAVADLPAYTAGVVRGVVATVPEVRPGGHVAFEVADASGRRLPCLAFEPTKTLPRIALRLRPGDRVRVWGGRGADPTFRLEGIEVLRGLARYAKGPNPACPRCGARMHSLGRARGFRCPVDHVRLPPEARGRGPPGERLAAGRWHPTPSARRHLHPRAPEPGRPGETTVRWFRRRPRTNI
jgi:tRNA(Ile2)-agmatinylcytidine synthase